MKKSISKSKNYLRVCSDIFKKEDIYKQRMDGYRMNIRLKYILDKVSVRVLKKNHDFVFVIDSVPGTGKCLCKGTGVLMSDGSWKNVEEIRVGDEVISPQEDGSSVHARVLNIHSRFEKDIYAVKELRRDKKVLYTCAGNHQIPYLRFRSHRYVDSNGKYKVRLTQYLELEEAQNLANYAGHKYVFTTTAIDYKQKDSAFDAYTMGALLGDGSLRKSDIRLHNPNTEIFLGLSNKYKYSINRKGKSTQYLRFTKACGIQDELEKLGLLGTHAGTKFIPDECMLSSIGYRWKLLAGMCDTDGYIDTRNSLSITTKSILLAEDIRNLVFSLGGYARIKSIFKNCQSFKEKREYFNISISFEGPRKIPMRCLHKKERVKKYNMSNPRHVEIEVVKSEPGLVYGFEIDSPSHWHITNDWVVTHNSTLATQIMAYLSHSQTGDLSKFPIENVTFNVQQFKKKILESSKGDCILLDEAMALTGRSAMTRWHKEIISLLSKCRSRNLFIGLVLPSVFDLDRPLVLHRTNFLIHCYMVKDTRGYYSAFGRKGLRELYLKGKKEYRYVKVKPVMAGRFTSFFPFDMNEYEKLKGEGIDEVTKDIRVPGIAYNTKIRNRLTAAIRFIHDEHGLTFMEVSKVIPGLSDSSIKRLYQEGDPRYARRTPKKT